MSVLIEANQSIKSLAQQRGSILRSWAFYLSLIVHLVMISLFATVWQGKAEPKRIKPPRYIEAKLVKLKQETKKIQKKKQPRKVDLTKRRKPSAPPKKAAPAPKAPPKLDKTKELKQKKEQEQKKQQEQARKLAEQKRMAELDELMKEEELMVAEQELEAEAQSFIDAITQQIEQNWSRPPSARNGMRCELLINLVPTGRVVSVTVVESSGNSAFDRSAEQAVKKAEEFADIKHMSAEVFEKYYRELRIVFNPQDLRQ